MGVGVSVGVRLLLEALICLRKGLNIFSKNNANESLTMGAGDD
jgi:hypothetical protein